MRTAPITRSACTTESSTCCSLLQRVSIRLPKMSSRVAERRQAPVEGGHPRPHPGRHLDGVEPDHPRPKHHHVGRRHPRNAAQQHPAAAVRLLQVEGADVGRHAAGHLRHGRQQRQPPGHVVDGLVSDGGHPAPEQPPGLLRIGRQVQVGEEHLARLQELQLGRLRLLHLDDQLGPPEDLGRLRHQARPPLPRTRGRRSRSAPPAPACTVTSWPAAASDRAPAGVSPTRFSLFLISRGHPTRMADPPFPNLVSSYPHRGGERAAPGGGKPTGGPAAGPGWILGGPSPSMSYLRTP